MDANKIHEQVLEKMSKSGFPAPSKPSTHDSEMTLPPDPSVLTSIELAQRLSKSASWFSYCQYRLGQVESELVLQHAEYKIELNLASIPIRQELGRQNADVIEAAVIASKPELEIIYARIAELTSIKETLEARLSVYDKFYSALSREQSRRDTESRVV